MKTYAVSEKEIMRKWYVVDLSGKTLGRAATQIATILTGKRKPIFSNHIDVGDFVIVVNADKFAVTGNKLSQKMYHRHSMYPGGLTTIALGDLIKKHPERVIELAVKGMLPNNKLRQPRLKRLKIYTGPAHPHQAQKPKALTLE